MNIIMISVSLAYVLALILVFVSAKSVGRSWYAMFGVCPV